MSASILRVRDETGNVIDIPAIVGPRGPAGPMGHSPEIGVDYFTEADKQEIVSAVLANFVDVSEVGQ